MSALGQLVLLIFQGQIIQGEQGSWKVLETNLNRTSERRLAGDFMPKTYGIILSFTYGTCKRSLDHLNQFRQWLLFFLGNVA